MFGLLLVMDRIFGKLKLIKLLAEENYKVITITTTLGSEHPIVPSDALSLFHDKLKKSQQSNLEKL
jgi:hypothetical protein